MQSVPESLPELVRKTCGMVAEQASHVRISDRGIEKAVASCGKSTIDRILLNEYDTEMHFVDGGDMTAQYLLVLDAINFCFWPDDELEYEDIARGLKAALVKNPDALQASALCVVTGQDVQRLVGWPRELPAQEERARLIREVGRGLATHFQGSAAKLILAADNCASKLVELTSAHFPGFRDHSIYKGRQVHMYKRAQIWVGDVWGAFAGQGLGFFSDIASLTMFADYRVPVTLLTMGILSYSTPLQDKIEAGDMLASGSEEEIEIRACTVVAVERLKERLCQLEGAEELNSVRIDCWLWEEGEKQRRHQQHHRTLTIYY